MSERTGVRPDAVDGYVPETAAQPANAGADGLASGLERLRSTWKPCLLQSALAGCTSLAILLVLTLENAVIVAALGASAFIAFGRPQDATARARNLIGGHMIGFAVGAACSLLPQAPLFGSLTSYALAVGLSVFIMVVLSMQHPPAAATALGVAVSGSSPGTFMAVLTFTAMLSVVHLAFRSRLRNLF